MCYFCIHSDDIIHCGGLFRVDVFAASCIDLAASQMAIGKLKYNTPAPATSCSRKTNRSAWMTNNEIAMTKNRTFWMPTNRTTFAVVSMTVIIRAFISLITNRATWSTKTPAASVIEVTTSVMAVVPITVIAMMIMIAMMTSMYSFMPTRNVIQQISKIIPVVQQ
jgi:hypothetical protein